MVGLEIKSLRAGISPFLDRSMKQPAADSGSPVRGLDGHLGHLKLFVVETNQGAAADASFTGGREENPAARVQNRCLWIRQNRRLLWLDTEESGDPFFIEPSECSRIPGQELADADFGERRGLLVRESHRRNPPSSSDDKIWDGNMSNI